MQGMHCPPLAHSSHNELRKNISVSSLFNPNGSFFMYHAFQNSEIIHSAHSAHKAQSRIFHGSHNNDHFRTQHGLLSLGDETECVYDAVRN